MAQADTDIEFRASDLVTSAGTSDQGEKLVQFVRDYYPPGLQAAQLKRINPRLDDEVDDEFRAKVAKVAGVESVEQVHIRGGVRRESDAVITYAFLDDRGEVWKGCLPYTEIGKREPGGHISQRDSLASSAIAAQHRADHPQSARARADEAPERDPFDVLEEASAEELVEMMSEHPERAPLIKAFEEQSRGKRARKSVLEFEPEAKPPEGGGSGGSS